MSFEYNNLQIYRFALRNFSLSSIYAIVVIFMFLMTARLMCFCLCTVLSSSLACMLCSLSSRSFSCIFLGSIRLRISPETH